MSRKFQVQERFIMPTIWGMPWDYKNIPVSADNVPVLRKAIQDYADTYTGSSPEQYRIITQHGGPVERWKVRPGKATKMRRRY